MVMMMMMMVNDDFCPGLANYTRLTKLPEMPLLSTTGEDEDRRMKMVTLVLIMITFVSVVITKHIILNLIV